MQITCGTRPSGSETLDVRLRTIGTSPSLLFCLHLVKLLLEVEIDRLDHLILSTYSSSHYQIQTPLYYLSYFPQPHHSLSAVALSRLPLKQQLEINTMATSNSHEEPYYGARLLPQVLDELAVSDPTRIYAMFPHSSDLAQDFRHVTVVEMSQAANAFAWWLEGHIGKSSSFETLAYMGIPDLRYVAVFVGAVKCGYKVSELLPRRYFSGYRILILCFSYSCLLCTMLHG